jgi:hypothetical protein
MRFKIPMVFLFLVAVFVAFRAGPVWSGAHSGRSDSAPSFAPAHSEPAGSAQDTWTVENRCRTLYLPMPGLARLRQPGERIAAATPGGKLLDISMPRHWLAG